MRLLTGGPSSLLMCALVLIHLGGISTREDVPRKRACVTLSCPWGKGGVLWQSAAHLSPRAPMNYLVLDLSKKSLDTPWWQSHAVEIEYCLRNYWCKKGNESRRHSWFSKYTHTAFTFIMIPGLYGEKILACFAFREVYVCASVGWLLLQSLSLQPSDFSEGLLLSFTCRIKRIKGYFFYVISYFPSTFQSHYCIELSRRFNNSFTFFNVFFKNLYYYLCVCFQHDSSSPCLFKTSLFSLFNLLVCWVPVCLSNSRAKWHIQAPTTSVH